MTVTYTATYSPEDNKLRLYASQRLDSETYARVKEAGFKWAPKQELFVAPKWNCAREDLLVELAGEIEPESMTLAERAAAKAERLDALAEKRTRDASAYSRRADELAEQFYGGQPILVGHHSERAARSAQKKLQAADANAAKARSAARHWLYKAEGVERHANRKNAPGVRARRIKTLLAELRDLQRRLNAAHGALAIWGKMKSDEQIRYALGRMDSRATFSGWETYSKVDKGELSPTEAREKCMAAARATIESERLARWIEHTLNRLDYERGELGDVPRFEGDLTPVILQAFAREHGAEKPKASETDPGSWEVCSPVPLPLHIASGNTVDITADDWRDLMQGVGYTVPEPKARKAGKAPSCPLINPTEAEAARLQAIWNRQKATVQIGGRPRTFAPRDVKELTQRVYSANAKGDYSPLSTVEIDAEGREVVQRWERMERVRSAEPVARVRVFTGGGELYGPDLVVRLTDKPGKALPLDFDAIESALTAAEAEAEQERAAA